MDTQVSFDYDPRGWQVTAHAGMRAKQYAVMICARQIGKTFAAIAELCHRALQAPENTTSAYVSPFITQSRRIAWPRLKQHLGELLPHCRVRESDLSIVLPGNRTIYLLGADNESARGMSIRNLLIDELDGVSDAVLREVLLPTTSAHGDDAWVCYIGTISSGESRLYQLYERYVDDPEWFTMIMPAAESGVFTDEWLTKQRVAVGANAFAREYACDPAAPVDHSVLGQQMTDADMAGRIVDSIPVRDKLVLSFDLGIRDFTSVWVCQFRDQYIEMIGYEEYSGIGLNIVLARLREAYPHRLFDTVVLPHDADTREMTSGASRLNVFHEMLPTAHHVVLKPAPHIADTLQSARLNIERCIFSEVGCRKGISRLKAARYEIDEKTSTVRDKIRHDNNSHALDSFRYLMHHIQKQWPYHQGTDFNAPVYQPKVHGTLG